MHDRFISLACLAALAAVVGAAPAAAPENGKKIYDAKCSMCHAKDGKGNAAMAKMFQLPSGALSLVSTEAQALPAGDFTKITQDGKGKMPSFKDKLQDADFADISAYVKALAKAAAKPAESPTAKAYAAKCASCHGKNGKGNAALAKGLQIEPASLDLTAPSTAAKTDAELTAVMLKGSGKMPAYEGKLSAQEIADLIRHTRSLAAPKPEAKPAAVK